MIFVGLKLDCSSKREVFRYDFTPTEQTHGTLYGAVIGPFRTMRGARFMAAYGRGNPHCLTVSDAEKLARASDSIKED
jgi:hypothetical protein